MKKSTINVIDLFSGCGGLSEGFLQSNTLAEYVPFLKFCTNIDICNYNILAHIEWEKPMVNTLRDNLKERWGYSEQNARKHVIHYDIQKVDNLLYGNLDQVDRDSYDNSTLFEEKGLSGVVGNEKVDLIIGGPPCQAYSIAGRAQDKQGMKNDYRNYLFESFAKLVEFYSPKMFVFENVPGLLSAKPGGIPAINLIYKKFQSIGYQILTPSDFKESLLDLAEFGVPQSRKRVIIIGVPIAHEDKPLSDNKRSSYFKLLNIYQKIKSSRICSYNANTEHLKNVYTFSEAVVNINKEIDQIRNHNTSDQLIFKYWVLRDRNQWSTSKKLDYYKKKKGRESKHVKYRSLYFNKPAPTIVAHLQKDGLMFIHPDANLKRTISVREAAALQSFPFDYIFNESMSKNFKMIGNAVPPLFARFLAHIIFPYLIENSKPNDDEQSHQADE